MKENVKISNIFFKSLLLTKYPSSVLTTSPQLCLDLLNLVSLESIYLCVQKGGIPVTNCKWVLEQRHFCTRRLHEVNLLWLSDLGK